MVVLEACTSSGPVQPGVHDLERVPGLVVGVGADDIVDIYAVHLQPGESPGASVLPSCRASRWWVWSMIARAVASCWWLLRGQSAEVLAAVVGVALAGDQATGVDCR